MVIHLKRQSSTYKTKWVVPTAVLTFLSFVSFWVKPNRPLRVGVLLTTAGALYLHVIYISSHSPTIPYSNAKDCWLSACALFIMAALIEYVIVRLFNRNVGRVTNQECKGIDHNSNELRNCHKNIHNGNKDGSQLVCLSTDVRPGLMSDLHCRGGSSPARWPNSSSGGRSPPLLRDSTCALAFCFPLCTRFT